MMKESKGEIIHESVSETGSKVPHWRVLTF